MNEIDKETSGAAVASHDLVAAVRGGVISVFASVPNVKLDAQVAGELATPMPFRPNSSKDRARKLFKRMLRPLLKPIRARLNKEIVFALDTSATAQSAERLLATITQSVELLRNEQSTITQSVELLRIEQSTIAQSVELLRIEQSTIAQSLKQLLRVNSEMALSMDSSMIEQKNLAQHLEAVTRLVDRALLEISSTPTRAPFVPLGDDLLVRSPYGWLLLPSEDLRLTTNMIENGGLLEPGTTAVIEALLSGGDNAVDVGAHVGTHTVAMARAVGASGRVTAIEPTPRLASLLRRTAVLSSLEDIIQVEECAAGASSRRAKLALGKTFGHNSLLPLAESTESVEVAVRPLDAILTAGTCPSMVKIDAEGSELEVWRGMARTIAETPNLAVVVEFGPSHLARLGATIEGWLQALTAPGFTVWEIDEASRVIRPLRPSGLGKVFSMNLLLLRNAPSLWPRLRVAA